MGPDADEPRRPGRTVLRLVLAFLVVRTVGAWCADIFFPSLVPDGDGDGGNPLLLVLLNPRQRYLLTAKDEPIVAFFAVSVVSKLLSDPFYFLIGRWYGDAGIRWAERRFGSTVTRLESMFKTAALPMVFLAANPWICLLAGASRMRVAVFAALNIAGAFVSTGLARFVGRAASGPLDSLFAVVTRYRWWLVGLSAVVVGYQAWQNRRNASVERLEEDLEAAAEDER